MEFSTLLIGMQDCLKAMVASGKRRQDDDGNPWHASEEERFRKTADTYALCAIAAGLGELLEDTKQIRPALLSMARVMQDDLITLTLRPVDYDNVPLEGAEGGQQDEK